jgi:hemerythrin-like domain-containing protein
MDPFELLKKDHKKVAELFDRLESASGKTKPGIFKQIKDELDLHTHVEELFLYPAVEKPEETHDLTLEAYEEHNVVKTLLKELSRAKSATDEWQAKAKVLRENVEHHVEEEENELFGKAEKVLSDEEIEEIGNRMEAEKARKQGRPVPKAKVAAKAQPAKGKSESLLSRVASFIGLGSDAAKKSAKKKPAATKSAAKKPARKKSAAKKAVASKTAAKKSSTGSKSASATSKRAPTKLAAKRTPKVANKQTTKSSKKSSNKK